MRLARGMRSPLPRKGVKVFCAEIYCIIAMDDVRCENYLYRTGIWALWEHVAHPNNCVYHRLSYTDIKTSPVKHQIKNSQQTQHCFCFSQKGCYYPLSPAQPPFQHPQETTSPRKNQRTQYQYQKGLSPPNQDHGHHQSASPHFESPFCTPGESEPLTPASVIFAS